MSRTAQVPIAGWMDPGLRNEMLYARSEALCLSASFLSVYNLLRVMGERLADLLADPALDSMRRARYQVLDRRLRRTVAAAERVTAFSAVAESRRAIADFLERFLFVLV